MNVAIAAVLLLVTLPLMGIIAILVRLTSHGPAIFVQQRIGWDRRSGSCSVGSERRLQDLGGKPFAIFKFRTMYDGIWPSDHQVWTLPNDRRVTVVGRILRLYRLDELPQLLNVLKGDMNLVGPRPEQPVIFGRLQMLHGRYAERQRVRPGVTGLAQVTHGYGGTVDEVERKLECDLKYLENRSVGLDLKVLLATIPVVIARRGAR